MKICFTTLALMLLLTYGGAENKIPYTDDLIRPEECPSCPAHEGWMMFEGIPAFIPQGFFDDPDTFKTTNEFLEWIDDPGTKISEEQRETYRSTVENFMKYWNEYLERDNVDRSTRDVRPCYHWPSKATDGRSHANKIKRFAIGEFQGDS